MYDAYLREERVTFLSRELSDWVPGEESTDQPWEFSNNRVSMSGNGTDVVGELYCYLEGQTPTRVAFDVVTRKVDSWTVTVYARNASTGAWASKGTDSTTPIDLDISSANTYDGLRLSVDVNVSTGNWFYRIRNLRYSASARPTR